MQIIYLLHHCKIPLHYANLVGKRRCQTLNLPTQIFRDRNLGAESVKIVYTRGSSLI